MEIMVLKHYSYKVMQRVECKITKKVSIERVKEMISSFIKADKEDPFLTYAEYYIYAKDKEGFNCTYLKELNLGKNTKRTLDNISFVIKTLKQIEEDNKSNKNFKFYTYIED